MFAHIYKYRLKCLLRNRIAIFWTLIFPIILSIFFYIAFSSINENSKFDIIDIAVINNDNESFNSIIDSLSEENEDQVFNTKYVTKEEAEELLDNRDITGFIEVTDEILITVNTNGTEATILKYVVDSYYQMNSMVESIIEYDYEAIYSGVLNIMNEDNDYLNDITNTDADNMVVYFYTLIGMVCLFGGMFGITAVNESEANLSKKGARISISPVKKGVKLVASLLAAFTVIYIIILIQILFINFVLGVSFGNQIIPVLFVGFCGSLSGITLGCFIASASRFNEGAKFGLLSAFTMLCCFFAGMMMQTIKTLISNNVPFLSYINPVNLITDALYSLYYYDTYNRYFQNIGLLLVFSLVLIIASIFMMRRKKYDSI